MVPERETVLDGEAGDGVNVLFFASAREVTGTKRGNFSIAEAPTVAQLTAALRARYGTRLEEVLPTCAIWVNGSPAGPHDALHDGDEVALLPPVSGG